MFLKLGYYTIFVALLVPFISACDMKEKVDSVDQKTESLEARVHYLEDKLEQANQAKLLEEKKREEERDSGVRSLFGKGE